VTHSVYTVTDSATDSATAVEVVGRLTRDGYTIEGRKVPIP
jgi:hypothetical protein